MTSTIVRGVVRLCPSPRSALCPQLFEFVRGRRHSLDPRNKLAFDMRLRPPGNLTLDEVGTAEARPMCPEVGAVS